MKILIDGITFGLQDFGGVSQVWEEYIKRLVNYDIKLKLIAPFGNRNYSFNRISKIRKNIRYVVDYFYWPERIFAKPNLRSALIEKLYLDRSDQIFHSTYFTTIFSSKIKKVVTVHDMIPELFYDRRSRFVKSFIKMKAIVIENSDKVITVSENTKKDVLRFYPHISEEKIEVIHNGIDLSQSKYSDSSLTIINEKYKISLNPREFFLFVGKTEGYKNFDLLINLVDQHDDFKKYIIVSVGERNKNTLSKVKDRNLHRNFVFPGPVSRADLEVLYENALALIYPSKYEGFGLPILEAMKYNCPVLCSDTSSLPEVGGEAAIYFDPYSVDSLKNAIEQFLSKDKTYLSQKMREQVKKFSWDNATRKLYTLYQSLCN